MIDQAPPPNHRKSDAFKRPGPEPLPGYRLLEPRGSGSFGEVWKCATADGLCRAIRFVDRNLFQANSTGQKLDALERAQAVQHPFVLRVELVRVVQGQLLIVMELADRTLSDLWREYRAQGLPGIPRDELLTYLGEAAEVIDLMNERHQLQHLDLKPRNLFVVNQHVKVADFGLVQSLAEFQGGELSQLRAGVTPLYAAPELFQGTLNRHSDQYSLAIVYQELLTGTLPHAGKNGWQLMVQHLKGQPDLKLLPAADHAPVARALDKDPQNRFPSCREFVQALLRPAIGFVQSMGVLLAAGSKGSPRAADSAVAPCVEETPTDPEVVLPAPEPDLSKTAPTLAALLPANAVSVPAPAKPAPPPFVFAPAPTVPKPAPAVPAPAPAIPASASRSVDDALPGYRFVEFLTKTPFAEVWKVCDHRNRNWLAQILGLAAGASADLLPRLMELQHPGLLPMEVVQSRSARVAVLSKLQRRTLRDCFQEYSSKGQPGIPREELLGYLRKAATVLDLFAERKLYHLGLHPRSLVLGDEQVQLADLGLLQLAWLPTGQPIGPLNKRYAAPELRQHGGGTGADQFSLALIYVEMLTGVHPFHSRNGKHSIGGRGHKLDLDLIPATDRDTIARALTAEPRRRYASCGDFVGALEMVGSSQASRQREKYLQLPPVVRCCQLTGRTLVPDLTLPAVPDLVTNLISAASGALKLQEFNNFRYLVHPKNILEHRCDIRLFTGGLKLRMQGFHEEWKGKVVHQDATTFTYHVYGRRSLLHRCFGEQKGLEVRVQLKADPQDNQLFQGAIHLEPLDGSAAAQKLVLEGGPAILQSLRTHLQVTSELRYQERWAFERPVRVYPVLPTLEPGKAMDGLAFDISQAGLGFLAPAKPTAEMAYLQLSMEPPLADFAILARLVRCKTRADGFEIGAVFGGAATATKP